MSEPNAAAPAPLSSRRAPPVSNAELEARYLAELAAAGNNPRPALWKLIGFYTCTRPPGRALRWLQELLPIAGCAEGEAWCLLKMGCNHGQLGDFTAAIGFYRHGLRREPADSFTWYFLHNNLGFCLNTVGRFEEGEELCRQAIRIDPRIANAYKNLGLALKGQRRWREAARAFITGTQTNPVDDRSSALLDHLLAEHPELRDEFGAESLQCRQAVQAAHEALAAAERTRLRPP